MSALKSVSNNSKHPPEPKDAFCKLNSDQTQCEAADGRGYKLDFKEHPSL